VVIHRAILGSTERFLGIMIEHYGGAFPVWLSPVQALILPISEKFGAYGEEVRRALVSAGFRIELDSRNESLGKKIRDGKIKKTPYLLVVGGKEESTKTITVESRDGESVGTLKIQEFIDFLGEKIKGTQY